ncbi:MAG: hypothetical protein R8G66_10305 [Cytophagales bacterium]|nr:hypothetical protein [Cytophagales bacterium]
MKRFAIKCALFLMLFIGLLFSQKLLDHYTPWYWGYDDLYVKLNFLQKQNIQYDVLFLGSSRSFRNTDPMVFDSLTGLKSFNVSLPGTQPPELYMIVEHLINQKADSADQTYIIELIDVHQAFIKNDMSVRRNYWMTLDNYQFGLANFMEKRAPRTLLRYTESVIQAQTKFGMGRQQFQSMRKKRDTQFALGPLQNGHINFSNQIRLGINLASIEVRKERFEADTLELWERRKRVLAEMNSPLKLPNVVHLQKIKDLIHRASEKNIKLVFVRVPIQEHVWGLFNDIPNGHKLDLGHPLKYPELYMSKFHFDHGHLSSQGAEFYTRLLSEAFLRDFDRP